MLNPNNLTREGLLELIKELETKLLYQQNKLDNIKRITRERKRRWREKKKLRKL